MGAPAIIPCSIRKAEPLRIPYALRASLLITPLIAPLLFPPPAAAQAPKPTAAQQKAAAQARAAEAKAKAAEADFARGLAAMKEGKSDSALHFFRAVLQEFPNAVPAYLNIAAIYRQKGNLSAAETNLKKARALAPRDPGVARGLADLYVTRKQWKAAAPLLRQVVAAEPKDPGARAVLGDGARRVATDVRASLDFHHTQNVGGPIVDRVLLTGPAVAVPGFAEVLERELGLPVQPRVMPGAADGPAERLSVASGLAVTELAA